MTKHLKQAAKFDDFVRRQQTEQHDTVDWIGQRDEWLSYIDRLYNSVEKFLKRYIDAGSIEVSYREIALNEEDIGEYRARQMLLKIGRQQVVFTPVGTVLIGTKGRVDVEGAAGKVRLMLKDKDATKPEIFTKSNIDWTWKIATPPPQVSYVDLTEETCLGS